MQDEIFQTQNQSPYNFFQNRWSILHWKEVPSVIRNFVCFVEKKLQFFARLLCFWLWPIHLFCHQPWLQIDKNEQHLFYFFLMRWTLLWKSSLSSRWNPIWLELKYIPQILFSILIPILFQFDAKLAKYYGKHFILMTLETVHCAKLFLKNIPHYFRCNHNRQYDFPDRRWWVS